METKITEYNELIAQRVPPGDRWSLTNDLSKVVYNSLTETLEAWFQKTQQKAEFRLAPLDSKLYVIRQQEEEIIPEEPQSFSIYGEFRQGV
jgi:CRISPR/Cas system endoribonuclease Cas6 (RAMP superfamily)